LRKFNNLHGESETLYSVTYQDTDLLGTDTKAHQKESPQTQKIKIKTEIYTNDGDAAAVAVQDVASARAGSSP
jgi:hypothetical protein